MMSSWGFPNLAAPAPSLARDHDIIANRKCRALAALALPVPGSMAGIGETRFEIADPYASQPDIKHDSFC